MATRAARQAIASDTLQRTPEIVKSTTGASLESLFVPEQLSPLDREKSPGFDPAVVRISNSDAFTVARELLRDPEAAGKTTVLNLASDEGRAGGWLYSLSKTQEEALCYSSTLYDTLREEYYPWPNLGPGSISGVYSPAIVVFKDDLDHDCKDLPVDQRVVVSVITVAAPRGPRLTSDRSALANEQDLEDLRGKIRLVYRLAGHHGQTYLVLGAMGCGAYRCPPRQVAQEMKSILQEEEFKGWFRAISFAIYANPGNSNFEVFSEVFKDTTI